MQHEQKYDEFGIPIKSGGVATMEEPSKEVDEFGIPIKKKRIIGATISTEPSTFYTPPQKFPEPIASPFPQKPKESESASILNQTKGDLNFLESKGDYQTAIKYLDDRIANNQTPSILKELHTQRARIFEILGTPKTTGQKYKDIINEESDPIGDATAEEYFKERVDDDEKIAYKYSFEEIKTQEQKLPAVSTYLSSTEGRPEQFKSEAVTGFNNALERGWKQGEIADLMALGQTPSKEDIKRIAQIKREQQALPSSKPYEDFNKAANASDAMSVLIKNPFEITSQLVGESLSALVRHGSSRAGTGAAAGALMGSVVPGIGTISGLGSGFIAGMGVASYNLEVSSSILESLQESGIDIADEKSLQEGFDDEEKLAKAKELAVKRGVPIALFDMFSAGMAGKVLSKPAKTIIGKIGKTAAEVGIQSGLAGTGEAAAQITSGQKISTTQILAEMIGEVGGGAPDIVVGTIIEKKKNNVSIKGDIVKAKVDKEQFNEMVDISEGSGQINEQQADELKKEYTDVQNIKDKTPDEFKENVEVIDLVKQKDELEAKKEKVDESFHPEIDRQIKEIKGKIGDITTKPTEVAKPTIPVTGAKPLEEITALAEKVAKGEKPSESEMQLFKDFAPEINKEIARIKGESKVEKGITKVSPTEIDASKKPFYILTQNEVVLERDRIEAKDKLTKEDEQRIKDLTRQSIKFGTPLSQLVAKPEIPPAPAEPKAVPPMKAEGAPEVKIEEPIAEEIKPPAEEVIVQAEEGNFTKKGGKWYDEKNVEVKDPDYVQYLEEEIAPTPKKFKPKATKTRSETSRLLSRDAESLEEAILQFFVGGGKIKSDDFTRMTGFGAIDQRTGKRRGMPEFRGKIWAIKKGGRGLDVLHEIFPEGLSEGLGAMDMQNRVMGILNSYRGKAGMMERLRELQKEEITDETRLRYEEDQKAIEDIPEKIADEVAEVVSEDVMDIELPEIEKQVLDKILDNHADKDGNVNWENLNKTLEKDAEDYFPSIPDNVKQKLVSLQYEQERAKPQDITPDVSREVKEVPQKGEATEPVGVEPTAGEVKAQKEYDAALADIEQQIVDAKKSKQNKLNKLSKSAELFGEVPKTTELFGEKQDLSKKNIDKQMQPYNDVITNLEKERQALIDSKEKQFKKYEGQAEIEIPKDEETLRKEIQKGLPDKLKSINKSLEEKKESEDKSDTDDIVKAKILPIKEVIQATAKPFNKFQEKVFGEQVDKAKEWIANKVKAGNQSSNIIKRWTSQFVTSWSNGIPRTAKDLQEKRFLKGKIQLSQVKFKEGLKKLHEQVGNSAESLERIHQVLDPEFYSDNPSLFGKKITYEDLTPNEKSLADTLKGINEYVHDWNFSMGLIDLKTYMANKGKYIARLYDAFEIPEDAKTFLEQNELPIGNKKVKLATDIFKARKEIDEWKKQNIIRDPVYLTLKRMAQTESNASILSYIDHIASQRGMVSKEPKAGFAQLNGKAYGKLNGAHVPNYIAEDFQGYFFGNQIVDLLYDAAKVYDRTLYKQFLKKYYTVYSPSVQLGNNSSNFVFAFLSGIDPVTMISKYPKAFSELRNKGEIYKLLVKNGILGSDVITADLRPLTQKIEAITRETDKVKKGILDRATKIDKNITDIYRGSDDIAKISAFMSLKEYGYSDAKAIELVYNGFQNYATVGKIWDLASKTPIIGNPFIKFQADLQRIVANAALRRPLSTAMFIGILHQIATLGSKWVDETEEEKEVREGRKFIPKIKLPDWLGGDVPLVFMTPIGEINLARFISPFYSYDVGDMGHPIEEFSKYLPYQIRVAEGREKGSQDYYLPKQDPLLGTWWATIIDDMDFREKSIQDPTSTRYRSSGATDTEKTLNAINYIARSQVPLYSNVRDMMSAWDYGTDFYGRDKSPAQTVLNTFIKIQDFKKPKYKEVVSDELNNIQFNVTGYESKLKEISRSIAKEAEKYQDKFDKGTITGEQLNNKKRELMKTKKERELEVIEKIAEEQEKWNKVTMKYADILK